MAERVSTVVGRSPVIFVAPHGFDDSNTDILTESAANECRGNAVINRGWERASKVDVLDDKANCNSIKHATNDVVKDEFYDPIMKMLSRISQKHPKVYVFHIHGCGNDIRKKTGQNLGVVIGWGDGEQGKKRPVATSSYRDYFTWLVEDDKLWLPAQAGEGSRFAGWNRDNLLQMWRHTGVEALQLEFVTAVRNSKADAEMTGVYLGSLVNKMLNTTDKKPPSNYSYLRLKI